MTAMRFSVTSEVMNEESTCSCFRKEGEGEAEKDHSTGVSTPQGQPRRRPTKAMGGAQWEKHGLTKTPEYRIWKNMRYRCNNPKCSEYPYYGGRGIKVCKQWDSFTQFLKNMGKRPEGKRTYTIERGNNDHGYCPHNCRWATYVEQNNNTRFNRFHQGKTIAQWSRETGLSHACITKRVNSGLDVLAPLGLPVWPRRKDR